MAKKKQTAAAGENTNVPEKLSVTPVRKLTVATVYGKVLVKDIPEDDELKLCRIAGTATKTVHGESNYGPWSGLVGTFAGANYNTGEVFTAATALLPEPMGSALVQALEGAQQEDAAASLKFSVDIFAVVSARDPNKYEYRVRPVIENDLKNEAVALLGM
jgi:hypothetical protein